MSSHRVACVVNNYDGRAGALGNVPRAYQPTAPTSLVPGHVPVNADAGRPEANLGAVVVGAVVCVRDVVGLRKGSSQVVFARHVLARSGEMIEGRERPSVYAQRA